MTSLLEVVNKVDSFPYGGKGNYYTLNSHDGVAIGYLSPIIVELFTKEKEFIVDHSAKTVSIDKSMDTFEKRNQLFEQVGLKWKEIEHLELKHGWRNELYTVYNPTNTPYLLLERAFSVLLGVVTYGTHINGYVPPQKSSNGKLKMWIPRRSPNKPTYPGMLDNTVAGGLGYPYGLWDTVVKECFEEAGLPEDFVKSKSKSVGVLLYMYVPSSGIERVQPEVEYIYDLEFDDETTITPHPEDGEAEDFTLMDTDEILKRLNNHEFKPNCGLVIIDFLIRHGILTPSDDTNFLQIQSKSHRFLPFPTM